MKKHLLLAAIVSGLMSGTAFAGTVDDIIATLQNDGFTVKEVDKTLLGNYKIEAYKGTVEREVVYSPFQDKVLRDRTDDNGDDNSVAGASNDDSPDSADDNGDDGDKGGDDGGDHDSGEDGGDHGGGGDGGDHDSGGGEGGDHGGGGDD